MKCVYCGGKYEVDDHVIPIAHGGVNRQDNLVPSCNNCNFSKGSSLNPSYLIKAFKYLETLGAHWTDWVEVRDLKDRICFICGKVTSGGRNTKLYCSDACKQEAYRIRKVPVEPIEFIAGTGINNITLVCPNCLKDITESNTSFRGKRYCNSICLQSYVVKIQGKKQ